MTVFQAAVCLHCFGFDYSETRATLNQGVRSQPNGGIMKTQKSEFPTLSSGPRWTEKVYKSGGGLDHLGVGSVVTDGILPSLTPGINVQTTGARYWSFYAFVLDEYWKRDLPRSNTHLYRYLRQKESIFSIAGNLCTKHIVVTGLVGSMKTKPLAISRSKSFNVNFNYLKSSGGGYSAYYATVMQELGVVRLMDSSFNLEADAITPEVGKELADAFREAISTTRYWKKYFNHDEVPASAVEEYGNVACLCRLKDNPPDRAPLVDIFLHGGAEKSAETRRASLRMILELSSQNNSLPIEDEDFRRFMIYRTTRDSSSGASIGEFSPSRDLISVARRWRLSQLREMFNWSLNGLFEWTYRWGMERAGDSFAMPIKALRQSLAASTFHRSFKIKSSMSDPIGKLIIECRTLAKVNDSLDGSWDLGAKLTEDFLFTSLRDGSLSKAEMPAAYIALYVLSLSRLWEIEREDMGPIDWRPISQGGIGKISLRYALEGLRKDERNQKSVADVLCRVVEDQVIAQHQRVALGKLPRDTFRISREGEQLRFFDLDFSIGRSNDRFNALSTICEDLNWVASLDGNSHKLTIEGKRFMRDGDLDRSQL